MPKSPDKKKVKPTLSIIGSGRLGTTLGMVLSGLGYSIEAVVTRRLATAERAAASISRKTRALPVEKLDELPPSKFLLITTPDDQIPVAADNLARSQSERLRGRIVLHTSGALASDVLASVAEQGSHIGSLHPLVSISEPRSSAPNLEGAFYCVEGDREAVRAARSIVSDLKGHSFSIPSKSKPLYHAAAVMASGHVVALFDLAIEMLAQCGLTAKTARRALLPLLESTHNNLRTLEPARALTGTFARADLTTVLKHLDALSKDDRAQALEVYRALGVHALDLAEQNGAEPRILREIKKVLNQTPQHE